MYSLRAFLILRHGIDDWRVSSHRELDLLLTEWDAVKSNQVVGVFHVGFTRPATEDLEPVVGLHPGMIFLTASAKYALPEHFKTSEDPIGNAGLIPVYLGTQGWGYTVSDEEIKRYSSFKKSQPAAFNADTKDEWLKEFVGLNEELIRQCIEAGIFDETSYVKHEHNLPVEARLELGHKIFKAKVGFLPSPDNIIDVLEHSPPWLLEIPVGALTLSTRPGNVLRSKDVKIIKNLVGYTAIEMSRWDSFGRRSMTELTQKLTAFFYSGPNNSSYSISRFESQADNTKPGDSSSFSVERHNFMEILTLTVESLSNIQAEVIELRMGTHGRPHTLQEIGQIKGVSRERIRQIESKAIRQIQSLSFWTRDVPERLKSILNARDTPLPFDGLEIIDSWFSGVSKNQFVFEYVLENFFSANIFIINSGDITYLSDVSQQTWLELCKEGRKLIENHANDNITIAELKLLLDGILCGCHDSLRDAYWAEVTKNAHFVNDKLVSVGFGLDHIIKAILEASPTPIHYKDFPRILKSKGNEHIPSATRCQNSCGNVAILLGRGLYGLERHVDFSKQEMDAIRLEVESLVSDGELARQWHSSELCNYLIDQGIVDANRINSYILNHALSKSKSLVFLGRMIWTSADSGAKTSASRLDIRQAIESVVKLAGKPLSTAEVRHALSRERGLNTTFQIFPEGDLIRLKPGFWGLISRDVPFNPTEIQYFAEHLKSVLEVKQSGLHISEIVDAVREGFPMAAELEEPYVLFGIAQRYPYFSLAQGGYIYLTSWNEPRRLNATEAVLKVLKDAADSGVELKLATELVELLIERPLPESTTFSNVAIHCGGLYDAKKMRWFHEDYFRDEELENE